MSWYGVVVRSIYVGVFLFFSFVYFYIFFLVLLLMVKVRTKFSIVMGVTAIAFFRAAVAFRLFFRVAGMSLRCTFYRVRLIF